MTGPDYFVLVVYGVGILGLGVLLGRLVKNPEDLFSAGGQSPWWVSGLSSFMTMFSAGTFVVWGGIAYRLGFVAVSISMCYGLAAILVGWTLAAKWKEAGVSSAAEFLQLRYGNSIVQFYTWLQGVMQVFTLGGAVYALALVTCTLIQLPVGMEDTFFGFLRDDMTGNLSVTWMSIFVIVAVIVVTLTGGLWAVLLTDTLQFIVLTVSVIFVVPLILGEAGGVGTFLQNAGNTTVDDSGNTLLSPIAGGYSGLFLFGWLVVHYAKIGGEWAFVQRFTCVPNPRDARKSSYLFGVMYLVSPLFWMLPAIAFRTISPVPETFDGELMAYVRAADYSSFPQSEQAALSAGNWQDVSEANRARLRDPAVKRYSERAYILACQTVLPPGMIGLMVAAMISATASMATTQLNVYAGAFTQQVYRRLSKRRASEKRLLGMGRVFTFLLGLLALAGALIIPRAGTYENYVIALTASLVIPLVLPTIWGLFSKKVGLMAAWTTTLLGVTCSLVVKFGFQGTNAWFSNIGWAEGFVTLVSRNTAVSDWMVGLTVPLVTLIVFQVTAKGEDPGSRRVAEHVIERVEDRPVKASSLPGKIVGWALIVLAVLFFGLIPFGDGKGGVVAIFAVMLLAAGGVTLFAIRRSGKSGASYEPVKQGHEPRNN
jgi:solute:Na+ symporter, SSS family